MGGPLNGATYSSASTFPSSQPIPIPTGRALSVVRASIVKGTTVHESISRAYTQARLVWQQQGDPLLGISSSPIHPSWVVSRSNMSELAPRETGFQTDYSPYASGYRNLPLSPPQRLFERLTTSKSRYRAICVQKVPKEERRYPFGKILKREERLPDLNREAVVRYEMEEQGVIQKDSLSYALFKELRWKLAECRPEELRTFLAFALKVLGVKPEGRIEHVNGLESVFPLHDGEIKMRARCVRLLIEERTPGEVILSPLLMFR